jgi:hypothetical protein
MNALIKLKVGHLMTIKVTVFVLCVSGFFSTSLIVRYAYTHSFPYQIPLGIFETASALMFAVATVLVGYDVYKEFEKHGRER